MATAKTTTLTFRIEPGLKAALRTAAAREHRSIANMVAVLIRDYCAHHGIAITSSSSPRSGMRKRRKSTAKTRRSSSVRSRPGGSSMARSGWSSIPI